MAIMAQATSHAPATARSPRVCTLVPFIINIIIDVKKLLLRSITLTAKSSKKMAGDKQIKNFINYKVYIGIA